MKKCFFYAVIVFGAAVFIWSAIAAMSSVGFSIGMLLPGAAGVALIAWALWHLKTGRPLIKVKWLRIAFVACVCLALTVALVLEALMMGAAAAGPEDDAGTVIVLGCGIFPDGRPTLSLVHRLTAASAYLSAHPKADVVVTGGQGGNEPFSEALAMKRYLVARGIDETRVFMEDKSTSTRENLEYALDIIEQNGLSTRAAVVTSDYHVWRALWIAGELGYDACGIAAPTPWRVWLSCQVREWIAIGNTLLFHGSDPMIN